MRGNASPRPATRAERTAEPVKRSPVRQPQHARAGAPASAPLSPVPSGASPANVGTLCPRQPARATASVDDQRSAERAGRTGEGRQIDAAKLTVSVKRLLAGRESGHEDSTPRGVFGLPLSAPATSAATDPLRHLAPTSGEPSWTPVATDRRPKCGSRIPGCCCGEYPDRPRAFQMREGHRQLRR